MWSVWKDNLIYLLLVPAFCRLYLVVVVDAVVVVVEVVGLRGTNDVTGFSSEVSFFFERVLLELLPGGGGRRRRPRGGLGCSGHLGGGGGGGGRRHLRGGLSVY